jgi:hypothetical protein
MLAAAAALPERLRELTDSLALHRITQATNALVQQANRYIDSQAPWTLRKTDEPRMRTVLWVLLEVLRHVGICSQPVTPSIASALLDQIAVRRDARAFRDLQVGGELVGGTPLPQPQIVVPRYEPPAQEEGGGAAAAAASARPVMSEAELSELEGRVSSQGELVRQIKGTGGNKAELAEAVARLLELKAMLPPGHEMLGGKKQLKK